ncbi:methionine ABC transporter ATP-binding protein MetN [Larkinella sp.]|uniref:methionine ABC transporter ATP-binding protein MetN n=1 Tax=Larkinella sp. TaxID=2034517 RepID=UPI003BAC4E10
MIELNNVTKEFHQQGRTVVALSGISLKVAPGKTFGVIGPSGAGKSTLIRCVNLLERPTQGEVIVGNKTLTALTATQLARERREIGMIFQHFNLMASRTVYENVAFPLELDQRPKDFIRQRVNELLKLTGLEEKVNQYPATLSGGQKQRVAIARTLASNPKVLLCDEATSALDPATSRSILKLLKTINQQFKMTILLITHEMAVVKSICDEVALISQGKLVEQGSVEAIFANPRTELAQTFIRSALHFELPESYQYRLRPNDDTSQTALLKLEFTGRSASEPLLSQVARLYGIDTKIISAQIDQVGGQNIGFILTELSGNRKNYPAALEFLRNNHVTVNLLGYV